MKTYFSITLSLIITLAGCNNPTSPNSEGPKSITFLSGQIEGWNYGTHRYIALEYLDSTNLLLTCSSSKIDFSGHFSLVNLKAPSPLSESLPVYPLEGGAYTELLEDTFACSDSSANIIWGELLVWNDTSSSWVGGVGRVNYNISQPEKNGDFVVQYCFVTKDVNLNGTIRSRVKVSNDSSQVETITHYDLSLTKGWNQEVSRILSQNVFTDSNKTVYSTEYSLTNNEPDLGKWIYIGQ